MAKFPASLHVGYCITVEFTWLVNVASNHKGKEGRRREGGGKRGEGEGRGGREEGEGGDEGKGGEGRGGREGKGGEGRGTEGGGRRKEGRKGGGEGQFWNETTRQTFKIHHYSSR